MVPSFWVARRIALLSSSSTIVAVIIRCAEVQAFHVSLDVSSRVLLAVVHPRGRRRMAEWGMRWRDVLHLLLVVMVIVHRS